MLTDALCARVDLTYGAGGGTVISEATAEPAPTLLVTDVSCTRWSSMAVVTSFRFKITAALVVGHRCYWGFILFAAAIITSATFCGCCSMAT